MTINDKSFAFAARSRMIDVKCDFKFGKSDLKCRKCFVQDESQEHLLTCSALVDNEVTQSSQIPQYESLFGDNPKKIKQISTILNTKFKLLNSNPIPSAHSTSQI